MRNKKGISMIALIITIIVIIILAVIIFIASGNTIGSANYAVFSQEFSDYALNFQNDALSNVKLKYGTQGKTITNSQAVYLASKPENTITNGVLVPAGVEFVTRLNELDSKALYEDGGIDVTTKYWGAPTDGAVNNSNDIACYELADNAIKGYKEPQFYGDNLGEEKHYVTQNGFVFTLPGYPREVDGENRMYIASGVYYVTDEEYQNIILLGDEKSVGEHKGKNGGETSSEIPEVLGITQIKVGDWVCANFGDGGYPFGSVVSKEGDNIIVHFEDKDFGGYYGGDWEIDPEGFVVLCGEGTEENPWVVFPSDGGDTIEGKVLNVGDYVLVPDCGLFRLASCSPSRCCIVSGYDVYNSRLNMEEFLRRDIIDIEGSGTKENPWIFIFPSGDVCV